MLGILGKATRKVAQVRATLCARGPEPPKRHGPKEEMGPLMRETNQRINIFEGKEDPQFYPLRFYPPFLKNIIQEEGCTKVVVDKTFYGMPLTPYERFRMIRYTRRFNLRMQNLERRKRKIKKRRKVSGSVSVFDQVEQSELDLFSENTGEVSELDIEDDTYKTIKSLKIRSVQPKSYINLFENCKEFDGDAHSKWDVPYKPSPEDEKLKEKIIAGKATQAEMELYFAESNFSLSSTPTQREGISEERFSEIETDEFKKMKKGQYSSWELDPVDLEPQEGMLELQHAIYGKLPSDETTYVEEYRDLTTDQDELFRTLDREEHYNYKWSNQMMISMVKAWRIMDFENNYKQEEFNLDEINKIKSQAPKDTEKKEPTKDKKPQISDYNIYPKGQRTKTMGIKKSLLKRLTKND